jgi:hypothetical protein
VTLRKPAPVGTTWLCPLCGKTGETRESVGDESCYIWAELVSLDSIEYGSDGRITKATVVKGDDE